MKNCTTLTQLRQRAYARFVRAGDAMMNLCDALLCETHARSLVELSLSPLFERQDFILKPLNVTTWCANILKRREWQADERACVSIGFLFLVTRTSHSTFWYYSLV